MATMSLIKIAAILSVVGLVSGEPPVRGYNNYRNSYHNTPSNTYLQPNSGYNPSNNYLPPNSYDSGYSGAQNYNHDHHGHEEPKAYEFGYSVKDAQSGNDYDRRESSDGNVVRGEYRVQLPDGRTQIVSYHADWQTGYHADVRYEGEARYPEPSYNTQQGYNYNAPAFGGPLPGYRGNGYKPTTAYGPPGFH